MKKRVLCYGDSLTWGYYPVTGKRIDERWTRVLAEDLGEDYEIIEEGLNGRTTIYDKPLQDHRNGLTALPYTLISQKPIDLIIFFLGTNDHPIVQRVNPSVKAMNKFTHHVVNADTIYAFDETEKIYRNGKVKALMIIPGPRGEKHKHGDFAFRAAYEISRQLPEEYKKIAESYNIDYLFAGDYAKPSVEDGTHYLPEEHIKLGHAVADKVKEIFERK